MRREKKLLSWSKVPHQTTLKTLPHRHVIRFWEKGRCLYLHIKDVYFLMSVGKRSITSVYFLSLLKYSLVSELRVKDEDITVSLFPWTRV